MKRLEVYDPAMCCSSGVCGPNVDPVLFARGLDELPYIREVAGFFSVGDPRGSEDGDASVTLDQAPGGNVHSRRGSGG